ncbi:syntaxin-binding protein 3 [Pancytospora philotis]|nr:syntaxin-binding protein 3 [Pancytospora philotis]KAI4291099.1 syntaxin-binding protein 3 [Pancytospora philotis]
MDVQKLLRKQIAETVLDAYKKEWSVLIYDETTAPILKPIFTKSDFLSHNIISSSLIDVERDEWDFPAIYFVSATKKISGVINGEFQAKKYTAMRVLSITDPVGLDPMIKATRVHLSIRALEERLFVCAPSELVCIAHAMREKPSVNYLPSMQREAEELAGAIARSADAAQSASSSDSMYSHSNSSGPLLSAPEVAILLVDRGTDVYTPLMHFFTFKSVLAEMGEAEESDCLYNEIRYRHLAEINECLQCHINRLNQNKRLLDKKKVDTLALSKMVVEAPANIEIKDAIVKYSELLNKAIKRLERDKDLVEAEQILATDHDSSGKKVKKRCDYFFDILRTSRYSQEDRRRLLFLMKASGITFTSSEQQQLEVYGFKTAEIMAEFDCSRHIRRSEPDTYKYDVSRYEPILHDLIADYAAHKPVFQRIGAAREGHSSLRKLGMLSSEKKATKGTIVAYIKGGITTEESRLAYSLGEALGIEILVGSNKTLTPGEFIEDLLASK